MNNIKKNKENELKKLLTKKQLKLEIVTCWDEIGLIKAWSNSANYNACLRSIEYIKKQMESYKKDLRDGNYIEDNQWESK